MQKDASWIKMIIIILCDAFENSDEVDKYLENNMT